MGHLFASGGKTVDGDGVRELYVGSLAHVGKDAFPASIDYLALGHLHVSQSVGNAENIRYSGSPLPMGFGEAKQQKSVVIVDFNPQITPSVYPDRHLALKEIPRFQPLVRIVGALDDIRAGIGELKQENSRAWLEIEYTGADIISNLRELLDEMTADSVMEIRCVKNRRIIDRVISSVAEDETLDNLSAGDVFVRCLDAFEVPDEARDELTASYDEIVASLLEEDRNAG